jgi:hypothetical protein
MSSTTRLLCGAAYLDDSYAAKVIEEIVEDEHRAVAPSYGFDLDPVVRHCYRARRLILIRDLVLSGLLLAGLVLVPFVTVAWLLTAGGVIAMRSGWVAQALGNRWRASYLFVAAVVLLCCCGYLSPLLFFLQQDSSSADSFSQGDTNVSDALASSLNGLTLVVITLTPLALAVGTVVTVVVHRVTAYRTMVNSLAADRPGIAPELPNARVQQRMSWVSGAQQGNLTMHSRNPLLGAGKVVSGALWSIAVTLKPRANPVASSTVTVNQATTTSTVGDGAQATVSIDPYDIHVWLRQRVYGLADSKLPEQEQVPGVRALDHVVADGERREGDPLIDPARRPYTVASPEAIAAIIRHPQGGLRYYQRFVIGVEGKPVLARDRRTVLPAQDQEIVVSAFVHVAVEGGKLYAEFLGMLLPPVKDEFHVVNRVRSSATPKLNESILEALRSWPRTVGAPVRAGRLLWQIATAGTRMDRAHRESMENLSHEYGARLSARELASKDSPEKFLQLLDAEKYIKLVEKAVFETLLDYLDHHKVDTSEYRARMTFVQNQHTTISADTITDSAIAIGPQSSASIQ